MDKKLKCVRFDNSGGYISPFDIYCKEQGIRHLKSSPRVPYFNGIAEYMNKILMERAQYFLSEAKLSGSYWDKALNTIGYIINLSHSAYL